MSLAVVAVVAAGVLVWQLERTSPLAAWLQGTGPVQLVTVGPSTLGEPGAWRGRIINPSSHAYYWGGCLTWSQWPSTRVSPISCLAGGELKPHSQTPVNVEDGDLSGITEPGTYRVTLSYTPQPADSNVKVAFAKLIFP